MRSSDVRGAAWLLLALLWPSAARAEGPAPRPARPPELVVYVNGRGGSLHAGVDDAAQMRSSILRTYGVSRATVPAFAGRGLAWTRMMSCVRDAFAGVPVRVVDSVPASPGHVMIMVGGWPEDVGLMRGEIGRAPTREGAVTAGAVGFAFSAALRRFAPDALCQTVAHEVGHMLGLTHADDCSDVMASGCTRLSTQFTPSARRAMTAAIAAHLGGEAIDSVGAPAGHSGSPRAASRRASPGPARRPASTCPGPGCRRGGW